MRLRKVGSILVLTLALIMMSTGIGHGQAIIFHESGTSPIDLDVYVDCAAGGVGEDVHLTGNIHYFMHVVDDPNGGQLFEFVYQPQGVSGVGLISGDIYRGTGITREVVHISGFNYGETYTFVSNYRIIGQGTGNNLMIQDLTHITITPEGELAVMVEHSQDSCQ